MRPSRHRLKTRSPGRAPNCRMHDRQRRHATRCPGRSRAVHALWAGPRWRSTAVRGGCVLHALPTTAFRSFLWQRPSCLAVSHPFLAWGGLPTTLDARVAPGWPPPHTLFHQTPVPLFPILAQLLLTPVRAWLQPPQRCVARSSLPRRPLAAAPLLHLAPQPALRRGCPWRRRRRRHRHGYYPCRPACARGRRPATGGRSGLSLPTLRRRRAVRLGLRPSRGGAPHEASRLPVTGLGMAAVYQPLATRRRHHCRHR